MFCIFTNSNFCHTWLIISVFKWAFVFANSYLAYNFRPILVMCKNTYSLFNRQSVYIWGLNYKNEFCKVAYVLKCCTTRCALVFLNCWHFGEGESGCEILSTIRLLFWFQWKLFVAVLFHLLFKFHNNEFLQMGGNVILMRQFLAEHQNQIHDKRNVVGGFTCSGDCSLCDLQLRSPSTPSPDLWHRRPRHLLGEQSSFH